MPRLLPLQCTDHLLACLLLDETKMATGRPSGPCRPPGPAANSAKSTPQRSHRVRYTCFHCSSSFRSKLTVSFRAGARFFTNSTYNRGRRSRARDETGSGWRSQGSTVRKSTSQQAPFTSTLHGASSSGRQVSSARRATKHKRTVSSKKSESGRPKSAK